MSGANWLPEALQNPDILHTSDTVTPGTVWRSTRGAVYVTLPGGALYVCADPEGHPGAVLNYLHHDAWDSVEVIFDARS